MPEMAAPLTHIPTTPTHTIPTTTATPNDDDPRVWNWRQRLPTSPLRQRSPSSSPRQHLPTSPPRQRSHTSSPRQHLRTSPALSLSDYASATTSSSDGHALPSPLAATTPSTARLSMSPMRERPTALTTTTTTTTTNFRTLTTTNETDNPTQTTTPSAPTTTSSIPTTATVVAGNYTATTPTSSPRPRALTAPAPTTDGTQDRDPSPSPHSRSSLSSIVYGEHGDELVRLNHAHTSDNAPRLPNPVSTFLQHKKKGFAISLVRMAIILNPMAGKHVAIQHWRVCQTLFNHAGATFQLFECEYEGHATELVAQLPCDAFSCVCVIGGDSTVSEVVNGLVRRIDKIPLAIIPGGYTNSFLSSLLQGSAEAAAAAVLQGLARPVDVIHVMFFEDEAARSPIADVHVFNSLHTGTDLTNNTAVALFKNKRRALKLEIDGHPVDGACSSLSAHNHQHAGSHSGSMHRLAPFARIDDGRMDITIVHPRNRREMATVMHAAKHGGRHIGLHSVDCYHAKAFTATSAEPVTWFADARRVRARAVRVCVEHHSLSILN